MRIRLFVIAALLAVIAASAALFVRPGRAEPNPPLAITANEIVRQWCQQQDVEQLRNCKDSYYLPFPDGSMYVRLGLDWGGDTGCASGIVFPDNVDGTAYIVDIRDGVEYYGMVYIASALRGKPSPPVCEFTVHRIS